MPAAASSNISFMIAKPYRAGELAQRIRRILDGDVTKKTRAESPPA